MSSPQEIASAARRISEELIVFARLLESAATTAKSPEHTTTIIDRPLIMRVESQEKPNTDAAPKPLASKGASYNDDPFSPSYDPPPPMTVEPVPPRPTGPAAGTVMVRKGAIIVCRACNVPLLIANRDIDNTAASGKGLSLAAYTFLEPGIEFPDNVRLYHEPTGKAIDCPKCHGHKSLWLVGNAPAAQKLPGGESVGSI